VACAITDYNTVTATTPASADLGEHRREYNAGTWDVQKVAEIP